MYKVVLLNLPFTYTSIPSVALTQLKYVLEEKFGMRVTTEIWYLNHDFVHFLGPDLNRVMSRGFEHLYNGLAEWFFRQTAFPAIPDNSREYLQKFLGSKRQVPWLSPLLKKRQELDAFLDEMIEKYHLSEAHLVGLTSMFAQNLACFSMARKLKERNADLVTVMGGANCETPMGEEIIKHVSAIDFVFSGPALITFPQFVEYRLNGDLESCHRIRGVFSKANCLPEEHRDMGWTDARIGSSPGRADAETGDRKDRDGVNSSTTHLSDKCVDKGLAPSRPLRSLGAHYEGSERSSIPTLPSVRSLPMHANQPQIGPGTIGPERDIDAVVELDYRSFLQSYSTHIPNEEIPPILLFETSRGCWWGERSHCTFCGLNGLSMNYHAMSPHKAIAYLNSLFAYADECTQYNCVDNILPRNYTREVLPFLNTPPNVSLFYDVKADLSEQDVQALSRARVNIIQPGIEALATATLKLMKKGTTVFQNLRLLKHCITYEIFPSWSLLLGFPGEKEEVYRKYMHDLPRLTHLPPPNGAVPVRFDRNSPYFTRAAEYGLDLAPIDFYAFVYPWSQESLQSLAYHFQDKNRLADYRVACRRWLGKIEVHVQQWQRAWWPTGEMPFVWKKQFSENRPQLLFKQEGQETLIHDSRSGKLQRYQISGTTKQILQYLDQPHKKADLLKQFDHLELPKIEQEMAFLQERGLLFEEDDRFMSLVLPGQPRRDSGQGQAQSLRPLSAPAVRKKSGATNNSAAMRAHADTRSVTTARR